MSEPINIILVEDHLGYRTTLIRALKQAAQIKHIHEYSTAEVALRELEKIPSDQTPDLLLLDLNLPGMSGLQSIQWFRKYAPKLNIIVLTQSSVEGDILEAMAAGASGYLLKSATISQITDAIESVQSGGASIDPKIAKYILKHLNEHTSHKVTLVKPLSERELQILTLLANGNARKEISSQLNISLNTVAYHIDHIYEKLNVENAPAAIAQGFRSGLL